MKKNEMNESVNKNESSLMRKKSLNEINESNEIN